MEKRMRQDQVEITVLKDRVRLRQMAVGGFRTSLDSVMLAAACPASAEDHILDLGCGVGAVGLCVAARVPEIHVTGVDIQTALIECACANAQINHVPATFVTGDIRDVVFEAPFDHVVCNPPYLDADTYTPSPDESRGRALGHHGQEVDLNDWIGTAHRAVKSRGTFTMIHRADFLDRIIQGLGRRFGATEIIPLYPRAGLPAKRVIVRTIKDRQPGCTIHPGLVLHEGEGWSAAARAILEEMRPL